MKTIYKKPKPAREFEGALQHFDLQKIAYYSTEALLRMVEPGAGFCGVTLCDVTTFMKIMSMSR